MSLFTRKPENPVFASGKDAPQNENVFSETTASTTVETVSMAQIYQALSSLQKPFVECLLAREKALNNVASTAQNPCAPAPAVGVASGEILQISQNTQTLCDQMNALGGEMIPGIYQRLERLEDLLRGLSTNAVSMGTTVPNATISENPPIANVPENQTVCDNVASLPSQEQESLSSICEPQIETADIHSAPVQPYAASAPSQMSAIFGNLVQDASIHGELEYLLRGIQERDPASSYFVGVILMFQSSAPDKMVLLLKDLGEALYRWVNALPENDLEHFQEVVVGWAQWLCENAGLQNRIELVRSGQRFDATRHNSTARGVTVTQVHGWVVLRGNGSVYSKALVDVQ